MATLLKNKQGTRCKYTDWLPTDVLTAAKARIKHILSLHDTVAVCFSGGKDSLAVLHLTRQVYDELGITAPVNVVFRDEELIPDVVIDFLAEYRNLPWLKLWWFAIPLKSTKYILGKTHDMVQWDPTRAHVRDKPSWAISDDSVVLDQYSTDDYIANHCGFRGRVCFMTGIRSQESLTRFRAIVNKRNDTCIAATASKRVTMGRPVYDWSEDDIFRFFYDWKIEYCPIYDHQLFNDESLRVATPLFVESAKRLHTLASRDPAFYDRILKLFPEVAVQALYYRDLDRVALFRPYLNSGYAGVRAFIEEQIEDPGQNELAHKRLRSVMIRARKFPLSYPVSHLLKQFASGAFKRQILPMPKKDQGK